MELTREVAAHLRSRVVHGELPPGARLPSERALAGQLKVSRVTVVRALTRLREEGLLVTRHGSGTFVATTDRLLDTIAPAGRGRPRPQDPELDLREATTAGPLDLLDIAATAMSTRLPAALRADGSSAETTGLLAELLARHLTATGLPTRPDELVLTRGAMAGLDLVVDALTPPGREAIVETPTFRNALHALSRRRRNVHGWPAGPGRWDPGVLARQLRSRRGGLLYLQPDGHNPTGGTMPPGVRESVVRTAAAAGWTVVADETMRPLRLAAAPQPPPLASYDPRVITISSMTKTVWGGLHLGWVRTTPALARRLRGTAGFAGPSALDQAVATELFGSLDQIIARRRGLLADNLQHLERRLDELRETGLSWATPTGGITLWLDLGGHSSQDVAERCARLGLLLEPASTYAVGGRDDTHLRIPFTATPAVLDRVVATLSRACGPRPPRSYARPARPTG